AGGEVAPDLLDHVVVERQRRPGRRERPTAPAGRSLTGPHRVVLLRGRPAACRVLVLLLLALRRPGRLLPGALGLLLRLVSLPLLRPGSRPPPALRPVFRLAPAGLHPARRLRHPAAHPAGRVVVLLLLLVLVLVRILVLVLVLVLVLIVVGLRRRV